MVVGLPVAITAASHAAVRAVGKFATVVAVAHRRSDVVAVTVVVTVVLVMVVVVVVDGITAMVMVPRVVVSPIVIGIVPAPAVVEPVVIPIGRVVVWTVIVIRPPPIISHVNT